MQSQRWSTEGRTPESSGDPTHSRWFSHSQLFVLDTILLTLAWGVAWSLRFEGTGWLTSQWREAAGFHLLFGLPLWLGAMAAFRLYSRSWTDASLSEIKALLAAMVVAALANASLTLFLLPLGGFAPSRLPLSVISSSTMWSIGALMLPRLFARLWQQHRRERRASKAMNPVLILGAGAAGRLTARELAEHPELGMKAVGFLDDDPQRHGLLIGGTAVLGPLSDLRRCLQELPVRQVISACGTASGAVMREIVQACNEANIPLRIMPPVSDILSGRVALSRLRPVQIQDLLRRAPVQTDLGAVRRTFGGQRVLVTGAGGSIGSELCRQIAAAEPETLLLLGHGENSIFEIQQELRSRFPGLELRCIIADIRDTMRIDEVFSEFRPSAVFHAAAHKHVPLMEENLPEAITNNVKGTATVVEAAVRHGVQRFVLISSDKAVNPSSIMCATKRIAELLVQRAALASGRQFVSVRFGNVLGSRGSVVPTFLKQIQAGGPVRITHPDMQRYFMTIPEAVQLVLQAGVQGKGSEVFVLDMGEPVRIVDLATDLIRLSGFRVGEDIEIQFTGLRPGEKLFEELSRDDENLRPTEHASVLSARLGRPAVGMSAAVDSLVAAAEARAGDAALRSLIAELVPEYIALGTTHDIARNTGGNGLTLVA